MASAALTSERATEYIDESLHGCAKTGITVRDGLRRRLCPQLAVATAAGCPCGVHGEGPADPRRSTPSAGQKSTFLHCLLIMVTCAWSTALSFDRSDVCETRNTTRVGVLRL
jgi:hypothetical protein